MLVNNRIWSSILSSSVIHLPWSMPMINKFIARPDHIPEWQTYILSACLYLYRPFKPPSSTSQLPLSTIILLKEWYYYLPTTQVKTRKLSLIYYSSSVLSSITKSNLFHFFNLALIHPSVNPIHHSANVNWISTMYQSLYYTSGEKWWSKLFSALMDLNSRLVREQTVIIMWKMENYNCDKFYELELTHVSRYGNYDLIREIRKDLSLNLKDS